MESSKTGSVQLGAGCQKNSAQQEHQLPKVNSSSLSASAALSHHLSPSQHPLPLPLCLSVLPSAWPSMFICLKTATIKYPQSPLLPPLLAAGVTALLEVQNPLTGVQKMMLRKGLSGLTLSYAQVHTK